MGEIPTRWFVDIGDRLLTDMGGRTGVAAVLVADRDAADQELAVRSIDGTPRPVESISKLLGRLADEGIESVIDVPSGEPLTVACRLDEVARRTPTHLVAGPVGNPVAVITRAGTVTAPWRGDLLVTWRRFDLMDASAAASMDARSPFPGYVQGAPLWEMRAKDATPLYAEIPELGPWRTPFGCFAFSTERAPVEFLDANHCGRAFVHPYGNTTFEKPKAREVPCLLTRLRELLPAAGRTHFVVNPGGARAEVALGNLDQPFLRTVGGVWRILPGNRFEFLHPWENWSRVDTLHWPGATGVSIAPLERSFHSPAPVDTVDLTEEERDDLVRRALTRNGKPPTDALDGFVLVLHDNTNMPHWRWLVFEDFTAALGWLVDFEQQVDLPIRIAGVDPPVQLGFAAGDGRHERYLSEELAKAYIRIARRAVLERYDPRAALEAAAAANVVLKSQRVHAFGYVRDLAVEAKDDPFWLEELQRILGPDGARLAAWLDERNVLAVDVAAASELAAQMGPDTWGALEVRSRFFLGTAHRLLNDHRARSDMDHSPVIVQCGKVFEVELGVLAARFRDDPEAGLDHDPNDRNDRYLRDYLDGRVPSSLGSIAYLLKPKADASPLRAAFLRFVRSMPGGETLTHTSFTSRFIPKLTAKRNPAAHDTPTSWDEANSLLASVVSQRGPSAPLAALVGWKQTYAGSGIPTTPVRLASKQTHLEYEEFRLDLEPAAALSDYRIDDLDDETDDLGDLGFFEHAVWMLRSGEFDRLVASGQMSSDMAETFKSMVGEGLDLMAQNRRPAPTNAGVFTAAMHRLTEAPHLDQFEEVGLIGHDGSEAAWHIAPGFLVGRTNDGLVHIVVLAFSGIKGDAYDIFSRTCSAATVRSLVGFLVDGTQPQWVHPRGTFLAERSGPAPCRQLAFAFQRTRPPGGYVEVHLDATSSAALTRSFKELADGIWGPLVDEPTP